MALEQLSIHEIVRQAVEKRLTIPDQHSLDAINRSMDAGLGLAAGFVGAKVRA
jgi:hypothetical protein